MFPLNRRFQYEKQYKGLNDFMGELIRKKKYRKHLVDFVGTLLYYNTDN